jgi:hypothetical protein
MFSPEDGNSVRGSKIDYDYVYVVYCLENVVTFRTFVSNVDVGNRIQNYEHKYSNKLKVK